MKQVEAVFFVKTYTFKIIAKNLLFIFFAFIGFIPKRQLLNSLQFVG